MPTGPISCFGDVSPVNRPLSVRKISPAFSQFCSTLIFTASSGPGSTLLDLVADLMPIIPSAPRLIGVTLNVHGAAVAQDVDDRRLVDVLADLFRQLAREADRCGRSPV